MDENPFRDYRTGGDAWSETLHIHGMDEALIIGRNYLDTQLKKQLHEGEKQFCRELVTEMFESTAGKTNVAKLVYPYSLDEAVKRMESSYYYKSRQCNNECARAIDAAIAASYYETNFYNLEVAAMKAIIGFGFDRISLVLAFNIQHHESDGRYSSSNKQWAKNFNMPEQAFNNTWLQSHATLVDSFVDYIRSLYIDLGAERYALPGQAVHGEFVHGYEITRSIMIDDKQGYAIAHNPDAVSPYVCWQFYKRDDGSSYNWGTYGDKKDALDNYIARIYVALN